MVVRARGAVTAAGVPAGLLTRWGIPADAELVRAERGCNNRTYAVAHHGHRWVLRISQNLSAAQARAEHRLLGTVRAAGLPFGVPDPVPTLAGETVAETPAGPATLCRWIPGMRPDLAGEPALERFGRAIGLLSRALRTVPWSDAPQDWRGDPLRAHPDAPEIAELVQALRDAGLPPARVRRLEVAARHVFPRPPEVADDLPAQVVHGDLGASNALVDERTGEVTGVLDFEMAGPDARVQDLLVGLLLSGALAGPGWTRRTAALIRGHAAVLPLDQAEIRAVPDLLVLRCVGSVFWRAGRWRRSQASLSDVADRVAVLESVEAWLAVHRGRLLTVLAAAAG
jgi:homoserine kinase type II